NSYQTGVISGELFLFRVVRIAASFSSKKLWRRGPTVSAIVESPFRCRPAEVWAHAEKNRRLAASIPDGRSQLVPRHSQLCILRARTRSLALMPPRRAAT